MPSPAMDRESRSELLKTIEAQKEKIHKYESKLRDLIVAYKGVVKEKEALEASVKALVASEPVPNAVSKKSEDDVPEGERTDTCETKEENLASQHDSELNHLREQLTTLTASLATLTQEKSKLEASFLADKKIIRKELDEKCKELEEERMRNDKIVDQLTNDLQQWKKKLCTQQHEREREHNDHALMLRELQKLLADERAAKEALEHQVDELKEEIEARSQNSTINVEHYEKQIEELNTELNKVKKELKTYQENAVKPSPEYLELQKQLLDIQTQHQFLLQKELKHHTETETILDKRTKESEERVSSLEAKISELSEMIGNYERLRTQDQNTIAKLKERITQLNLENSALAEAANRSGDSIQELSVDSGAEVQSILDKILKLKELLKAANERSEKPLNIEELLQHGLAITDTSSLHKKCKEEYDQLKEEFERYKLRAQSVLKSKSSKEPSPCAEIEALQCQVSELKERLYQLRSDYEEQSKLLRTKEDTYRMSMTTLQERHAQQLVDQEAEFKQRMSELDAEIRRHRERTVSLLAEKDRELESLRMRLPEHFESHYFTTYRQFSQSSDPGEIGASSEGEAAVSELLTRTSLHGMPSESTILHFAQEQARKEVEIQALRKQKHGLELAMRELQQSSMLKEQQFIEQIDLLKEEIRKYERNISRESANLEYLKNVVYHFMVCSDQLAKQSTLNAISTILQFSPQEKDRVQRELQKNWWYYVNSQKKTKI